MVYSLGFRGTCANETFPRSSMMFVGGQRCQRVTTKYFPHCDLPQPIARIPQNYRRRPINCTALEVKNGVYDRFISFAGHKIRMEVNESRNFRSTGILSPNK